MFGRLFYAGGSAGLTSLWASSFAPVWPVAGALSSFEALEWCAVSLPPLLPVSPVLGARGGLTDYWEGFWPTSFLFAVSFLAEAERIFLWDASAAESASVLVPSPGGAGLFSLFELNRAYSEGVIPTSLAAGFGSFRDF